MLRKSLLTAIVVTVFAASTAYAQYPGPMPGGMGGGSGMPTYTQRSYGINKAALGAALGGGVAGGVLLLRHHRHTMTACVGSDGRTLSDGKDVYNVVGGSLIPNERLVVAGKKMKSDTGEPTMEITAVRKDLGHCEVPALSARK